MLQCLALITHAPIARLLVYATSSLAGLPPKISATAVLKVCATFAVQRSTQKIAPSMAPDDV